MQHIFSKRWSLGLIYGLLGLWLAALLVACGSDTAPSAATPTVAAQVTTTAATTAALATTQAATTAAATTQSSLPTVTPLPTTAAATTAPGTTVAATTAAATTTAAQDTTTAATQPATTNAPATAVPTTAPATKPASSGKLRLAYVAGGKLHVLDPATKEDKTLGNLTVKGRPDWSPDGNSLVVTKSGKSGELSLLDLAGGSEKTLTSGANDSDPRFSPDGKLILFTRLVEGRTELWLVDSNGQNAHKLTNGHQGAWGPDSQRIAFVTNGTSNGQFNALHLINAKGQNEWEPASAAKLPTDLSAQGFPFGPSTQAVQYPTWLDGGKTIGFTTIGHSGLLVTVSSTSAKDVKVWDTQYEGGFGATDSATQGSWLVYETFPPSGFMGVSLMNTAGTPNLAQPNNISIDNPKQGVLAARPAISPDGSRLAYLKLGKEAASGPDDQPFNGTLTIAQFKGGQISGQQEFGKGQISAMAWSK